MDETAGAALVRHQLVQVRQRWWIVAAATLIGVVLACIWSLMASATTWTATTALSSQSQERAPEQDAVLTLGYVNYFNQAGYQELLRSETTIPSGVTLTAQSAATSPILYIEATGSSEAAVREAATVATDRFRDDVYRSLAAARERAAGDLQTQVDANTAHLGEPGYNEAVVLDQIRSLQGRITDIYADNTNLLKQLQPQPGVTSSTPSPLTDIATGAFGGAVVGAIAAFLLGMFDSRVRTPADITARTGLSPVVALHRRGDPPSRRRQIGNLTNVVTLPGSTGPVVLAVVSPRRCAAASALARELASESASRRAGALLVHTDLDPGISDAVVRSPGLAEVLGWQVSPRAALTTEPSGLAVLAAGDAGGRPASAIIEPDRLTEAVAEFSMMAGLVVLDAPALLEAAESQVVCAAADRVLLVAGRGETTVPDLIAARDLLGDVHARLAGTVLDDPVHETDDEPVNESGVAAAAGETHLPEAADDLSVQVGSVPHRQRSDRT